MFYRAAVLTLLGALVLLQVDSEVRRVAAFPFVPAVATAIPAASGPAAPVSPPPVPPAATPFAVTGAASAPAHALVAPETRLVDISGAELDRLFTETDPAHAARIVPHLHDGHRCGVKLYAIRPGSLFEAIGLRNGDVLIGIDDAGVDDAEHLTALPGRLVEAPWIDLSVLRRGLPLRIVVLVHR